LVAFEAVAARETAPSLEEGVVLVETADHFIEGGLSTNLFEFGTLLTRRVCVVPGVQPVSVASP